MVLKSQKLKNLYQTYLLMLKCFDLLSFKCIAPLVDRLSLHNIEIPLHRVVLLLEYPVVSLKSLKLCFLRVNFLRIVLDLALKDFLLQI